MGAHKQGQGFSPRQPPRTVAGSNRCRWIHGCLVAVIAGLLAGCESANQSDSRSEQRNPHYQKAKRFNEHQDYQAAADAYQRALRVNPDLAAAHLELGLLFDDKLGDPIGAIYHYRRFLELDPGSDKVRLVQDFIERARLSLASKLPQSPIADPSLLSRLQAENATLARENARFKQQLAALEQSAAMHPRPTPPPPLAPTPMPPSQPRPAPQPTTAISTPPPTPPRPAPMTAPTSPQVSSSASPPAANAPVPVETRLTRSHIVQRGDTLQSLALMYYGTRSEWDRIYQANRGMLQNKDDLKIGQRLIIP